jgi:citronellol/citronellal dehydrogenase
LKEFKMGKVAFITGATRGIGKACGLRLAREGWDIAVAGRSVTERPELPGTIYSVAEEIAALGVKTLPVQCNVIDLASVDAAVATTLETFGRIDAVINNAGALWWRNFDDTPMKKFDLVTGVNVRGSFAVTAGFMPAMRRQNSGHVIFMSPPVDTMILPGHIAYLIGKFGMTMIALGLGEELQGTGISATALWPKTVIESYATINFKMGLPEMWRKPDIIADATYEILQRPEETRGKALIDEEFLRSIGYTDFERYNCVEGGTPLELTNDIMRIVRF